MIIWLKNLIGIIFILHSIVYGVMLIPFPNMQGSGIGKYWTGFVGSKILNPANISNNILKTIAIIISLIAMVGFIIAGITILTAGFPNKLFLITTLVSASISVIFLILYWHNYNIVGFLINIAILIYIPILYTQLN